MFANFSMSPVKGPVDLFWRENIFMAQLHRMIFPKNSPNDCLFEGWELLAPTKKLESQRKNIHNSGSAAGVWV